ncbi:MAG: xanthine phosphoribosyltransferase [Erysipelothrix sp.]|nr:xanthine phosphoribosyltransferase [Erysipelothrix sp.]
MELLENVIREEAKVKSDVILDVTEFLNAKVDVKLMDALGKDFAAYYKDYDYDLFVTVEASGIAPSVFASLYADKPLIIIKKQDNDLNNPEIIQQASYSFTKDKDYFLTVGKRFIEGKKVILIDDFLAKGSVVKNVKTMLESVDAELVSTAICISKNFQEGYQHLLKEGFDLYVQAQIESLDAETNTIEFA